MPGLEFRKMAAAELPSLKDVIMWLGNYNKNQ